MCEYLGEAHLDRLRREHTVLYDPDLYLDRPRLLAAIANAEAIVTRNRTQVDRGLVNAATRMRVVGRLGVGLDNIDLEACSEAGIAVRPAVGANAIAVAEYVMGAMLALLRPVFGMTESLTAGEWPRQGHAFGAELAGKTLGLVGLGMIAQKVAARSRGFEMAITAYDPHLAVDHPAWNGVDQLPLEELLRRADVLTLHVPLTEETRSLIGAEELRLMKPTSILINTSRGGVVDEAALAGALRAGVIAGAAVDVFTREPLGPEQISILAGAPNLILTPHLAGNSREAVERVAATTVTAVLETLRA